MAIPLPIMQKKKIYIYIYYFGNCGNPIADNVKKKKKFIFTIVAIPLPKMEKKNYEIRE